MEVWIYFISDKLVKKVIHRTASGSLLAQSYLSSVLLFAGLYTLEFRFNVSRARLYGTDLKVSFSVLE